MKKPKFIYYAITILLLSAIAVQWYTIALFQSRQRGAYESLLQTADDVSSMISSGRLNKEDSQKLRATMVPLIMNIVGISPDDRLYSSISSRSVLSFCNIVRQSEKIFPNETDSSLDAQIFPVLRNQLQSLRPALEKHINSRNGLAQGSMASCHWVTGQS